MSTERGLGLVAAAIAVMVMSGCGATSAASDIVRPDSATAWAEAIRQPTSVKVVTITEDNDPNDLIGRPNGYVDAAVIVDSRVDCDELGVTCGATLEIWPDAEGAARRSAFIQETLVAVPMLGSEFHETHDTVLLRITGGLTPTQAQAYLDAFEAIAEDGLEAVPAPPPAPAATDTTSSAGLDEGAPADEDAAASDALAAAREVDDGSGMPATLRESLFIGGLSFFNDLLPELALLADDALVTEGWLTCQLLDDDPDDISLLVSQFRMMYKLDLSDHAARTVIRTVGNSLCQRHGETIEAWWHARQP